ncbi:beta-lactamase [Phlyctema vagabunda]|uniref:Beta-lactamase n=1 Tax=Phlyctema vagabunda TaxID=108571 RepID=A0ABR4PE67_9HELO
MDTFSKLEQIISNHLQHETSPAAVLVEEGTPTASIAVLDGGNITSRCISAEGHNEETLFQACSISKPVAGTAMSILVGQGKAKFEDKIVEILPRSVIERIETPSTSILVKKITIKMLMSHTSGLSVHGFAGYVDDIPSTLEVLSGRAGINTRQIRLDGIPGQRFSYSGGGMTVLQLIIEYIAQKPFSEVIQGLIFGPLGMHRSFYNIAESDGNLAKAHYTGYTACEVPYRTNPEQAAAGLWTTPTDLLKLVYALQRSLKCDDGSGFLDRDIARELLTEVKSNMGLTWLAPQSPGFAFAHAGSNEPGWNCMLIGYTDLHFSKPRDAEKWPELFNDCGIAVMTNSATGISVIWKILNAIAYIKGWSATGEVGKILRKAEATIPFASIDKFLNPSWEIWIGDWSDDWKIEKGENGNGIAVFGGLRVNLVPAATPVDKDLNGSHLDVLLQGLEIMLRMGTDEKGRLIEIYDGGNGRITLVRPVPQQ